MKRIQMEQAAKIHTVLALCRSRGVDPIQVLDEGRLLRHAGTQAEDGTRLMQHVIDVVRQTTVPAGVRTPMDMRNLIIEWLEKIRDAYATYH